MKHGQRENYLPLCKQLISCQSGCPWPALLYTEYEHNTPYVGHSKILTRSWPPDLGLRGSYE